MTEKSLHRQSRRGPGRLPAEEAARIDDRLLEAATNLFFAHGYERTTMEGVARAAGASTKTLYQRYPSKSELLLASIRHYLRRAIPAPAPESEDADARATLRALGLNLARVISSEESAGLNRLMFAEAHRFPELGATMEEFREQAIAAVEPTLRRLEARGLIGPLADGRMISLLFLEMTSSAPRLGAMLGQPAPDAALDQWIGIAVDVFLDGCAVKRG